VRTYPVLGTTRSGRRQRAASRPTLSAAAGFAVAAYVIFLGFFASVVPSPLYGLYQHMWGFSPFTLSLIYAVYAVGVLVALLLVGSLSDEVGRRPVLLTALAALLASTLLFIIASSTEWLFIGRGVQGFATGAAISAASATLVDLQTRQDPVTVSVTTGVASNAGLGLGIFVVSVFVQWVADPLIVPYLVLFALLCIGIVGVYQMPEPVTARGRLRLTAERPQVPTVVRGPFLLAALTVLASWSIAGLFFSLGPMLGARLFDTTDPLTASAGIYALLGTSALTQLLLGRTTPWVAAMAGSLALAGGMILILASSLAETGAVYLIGSIISGVGFGLSFLGGLRGLVSVIPATHRAGVLSAFYVVAYLSLSVPAVLAGIVVGPLGLRTTFAAFSLFAAVIALVVAAGAWRTRPARTPAP